MASNCPRPWKLGTPHPGVQVIDWPARMRERVEMAKRARRAIRPGVVTVEVER